MFTARLSGFVVSATFASLQNCKISLHCDLFQINRHTSITQRVTPFGTMNAIIWHEEHFNEIN